VLKTLAGLVAELRSVGIPVSPTEHIDAAAALKHTALEDRSAVRTALATTLVKNPDHLRAFITVFDLYFAGRRGDLEPSATSSSAEAPSGSFVDGAGMLGGMSDEELADVLYRAIRDGDRVMMRAVAAQLVDRHSNFESGRRVAGVYYMSRALAAANLSAILDRLQTSSDADDGLAALLTQRQRADRIADFRTELQTEIRDRLVADRGPDDVARVLRAPLPEDVDFLSASGKDAAAIREALKPLARKLAARLARRRRSHRDAPLDFRATLRKSLSTGGIPVQLVHRKPHPARPDLIVLADISGSVATFAAFTLQLVFALRSEFARVRTFAFVDGIDEVTELLEKSDNVAEATHRINYGSSKVRLFGGSDYGFALRTFEREWGDEIRNTSTVLILGDARNNYLASRDEALAAVGRRARHLYWLNPEPASRWDTGDSIMSRYAQHCDGVFECRNVRQLTAFVDLLE
jgi:uncharacterized protein with von Willebrand factor type A (vWA) domain